jgi:osmotically-inducible protein OsmY
MNGRRILAVAALGTSTLWLAAACIAIEPSHGPASATDDRVQAEAQSDSSVAAAVHERLAAENNRALNDIRVSAAGGGGVISLSGRVYAQDVADRAVALAKSTDGVTAVKNNITVAPESRRGS